jgi:Domain of unknown function (DUF4394)
MLTLKLRIAPAVSALALAAVAFALPTQAATVAALQDGKTIAWIDTDKMAVTGSVPLAGGASLIGFDVRPSDGKLYGVTADGVIVTVDPMTGKWDKKSDLSEKLPAGATYGKATVDGSHKYAEADKSKGATPKITAGAYINSMAGVKETALFNIDAASGNLVKQAPPNDGTLVTIGALGVKVDGPIAFDIMADGKGGNAAWLLAGGTLHSVDLTTGAAKAVGPIAGLKGQISDMAILPAK